VTRRTVSRSADITIERTYRVDCPQCGQVGDLCASLVDANTVRHEHWARHRDQWAGVKV